MGDNNKFIESATKAGYSQQDIQKYLELKQNNALPPKRPINTTSRTVETNVMENAQSPVIDFFGSGFNAAVDMVKAIPLIEKSALDLMGAPEEYGNALAETSKLIDSTFKYRIAPENNNGVVKIEDDGSIGFSGARSIANGIGNGVGQLAIAIGTGGESIWGRLASNTLMNFPSVYESAEQAGLDKKSSAKFSLLLAPILAATEELGGLQKSLAKNIFGKAATAETKQIIAKLRNEAITETLERAGKGEISDETFERLAKDTSIKFLTKIKNASLGTLKEGTLPEMGQEMFQDALQQGAEQMYDKFFAANEQVGQGKFGTEFLTTDPNKQFGGISIGGVGMTKKAFVSQVNNGVLGGLVGGSAHIAINSNPAYLQETLFGFIDDHVKNGTGDVAMDRITKLIDYRLQNNEINEQDAQKLLKKAQQIYDVSENWKDIDNSDMLPSKRYEAYDLTANILPVLQAPIQDFENTFKATDLPTAIENIDMDNSIDDFKKGSMKKTAMETYTDYYKATQKREAIKGYLQQLGTGKQTSVDLQSQIKAIDDIPVKDMLQEVINESIKPKSQATKEIYDFLSGQNEDINSDISQTNISDQTSEPSDSNGQSSDILSENLPDAERETTSTTSNVGVEEGSGGVEGDVPLKENEYYHATDNNEIIAPSDNGYKKREGNNVVGEGIYFGKDKEHLTDRYGKNAIKVELDIKNPLVSNNKYIVVDGREIDVQSLSKDDINFLKEKGYDAIKYVAADKAYSKFDETIVFEKTQIKKVEQSLKENQSESQENNKISSDEQQRAELADIIDAGITENPEGAEEAAILNSLGLSLENESGTRNTEDNGPSKTNQSTSQSKNNDKSNDKDNKPQSTTSADTSNAGNKGNVQQTETKSEKSNQPNKNLTNEKQDSKTADDQKQNPNSKTNSSEGQTSESNPKKTIRKIKGTPISRRIIRNPDFLRALEYDVETAYDIVLQAFISGTKVTSDVIAGIFKKSKGEINARKFEFINNKDGYASIYELATKLWEDQDVEIGGVEKFDDHQFANAIANALLENESKQDMVDKLNQIYGQINPAEDFSEEMQERIREMQEIDRQLGYNQTQIDEAYSALYGMTEEEIDTFFNENDSAQLEAYLESLDKPASKKDEQIADVSQAEKELEILKAEKQKAQSEYDKKQKSFAENANENQIDIFGLNKPQSMFDDKADQARIVKEAKDKLDQANEAVKKAEQNLIDKENKVGQEEIEFKEEKPSPKEKSSIEKIDDEIANLWDDLASSIGAIKKFDGNGGPDPKALEIGIKLVMAYGKKGIYQIGEMAEDMAEKFGEVAKDILPYLKDAYNSVRGRATREERSKFNNEDEVFDYELKNNKQDVPNRSRNSKPNSNDTADNSPTSENTDGSNGGRSGQDGVRNSQEDIQDIRIDSSESIHNLFSPTIGEQGNIELRDGNESASDKGNVAGNFDGRGSRIDGNKRVWPNENGAKKPLQSSDTSTDTSKLSRIEKAKLQKEAESVEVKIGDLDNIKESLPFLLPEQHVDVLKTENRFNNPEQNTKELAFGKGILFTNSTGTGKTFTGLGIAKRFSKQGKNNILIVTPSQAKVSDWQEDGKALSLDISFIENTKDGGKGVVVTTFANFRENKALLERDFDLIIYDESHRLMEDKKGSPSSTTYTHYEMSNKTPDHAFSRISSVNPLYIERDELKKSIRELRKANNDYRISDFEAKTNYDKIEQAEKRVDELTKQIDIIEPGLKERAQNAFENTKVVFLSATPFKAHFNLRYANGFLFNWSENTETNDRGSRVDGESRFYLENFGSNYEWKYHRLQVKPDINPDAVAMQEIEFAEKLIGQGVMSGRMIDSDQDYSREFPRVSGFDSQLFNKAFNDIFDYDKNEFFGLREAAREVFFNYNYTTQLFESLKCSISIPRIKKHIALGRKVVVFHRRQQANSTPPFQSILDQTEANQKAIIKDENSSVKEIEFAQKVLEQIVLYKQKHQEVLDYEKQLNYSSAVDQMKEAFGDNVAFINGSVSTSNKNKAIKNFNTDSSPINVIVIQEEAGKEGISLHDTTGKHQRALINLSMPISTVTALQIEGRIYRLGQQSDAVFEYPLLGLDMETAYFGNNINKRLSTTENLAIGKLARDLIRSYSEGVLFNSSDSDPSTEQGKGGKGYDKKASTIQNDFEKAKLIYATNQKTRGKRDQREGYDFYATPEPLGQKMVEWANLTDGEHALEPSAGNGAIAMWVKPMNALTAIEPSFDLYSKLTARAGGGNKKVINTKFEDFHITNKFDAIVMNPPFGQGGSLAIKHIEKAFSQLREGGRIVAIIPSGSMDVKLEKFFNDTDEKGRLVRPDAHLVSSMLLPSSTFSQAGTSVNTRVVIIDKSSTKEKSQQEDIDFRDSKSISELFDSIEKVDSPERAQKPTNEQAEIKNDTSAVKKNDAEKNVTSSAKLTPVTEYINTKTGSKMFITRMATRLSETEYRELNQTAKSLNGFYSSFSQAKGFLFKNIEDAKKFHDKVSGEDAAAQFATGNQTASTEQEKAESQAIIDFFKKGLKADVFAPTADFDSMLPTVTNDQKMISESGKVLGFVKDGKIYLNPKTITPQTTFHEIIHIQQSLIEIAAKKGDAQAAMILKRFDVLLGNAVNEIISGKKSVTIDGVKVDLSSDVYRKGENESDAMYRTRVRNELWSYIQAPVNESKWKQGKTGVVERFIEAVKKFFRDKLGLKKADNIQSMTLSELIDTSANSLMKGEYFDSIKNSPQTININGKETTVKNIDAEVVNGFYSPLENIISETKIDKLPAKQWIEKFGKGDEAKWTGLTDWLNKQEGSVSKADIQQFLKDNRIQVVEVVKSDDNRIANESEILDAVYSNEWVELGNGVRTKGDVGGFSIVEINGNRQRLTRIEAESLINKELSTKDQSTKFSQYQLEGEKENYKEVLVTMPSRTPNYTPITELPSGYDITFDSRNNTYAVIEENQTSGKSITGRYHNTKEDAVKNAIEVINAQRKNVITGKAFDNQFKSSHFDEPNILVHLRMNTRTDADGNKILMLEEIQSDFAKSYKTDMSNLIDFVNKNEESVIEMYKKSGKLAVEC